MKVCWMCIDEYQRSQYHSQCLTCRGDLYEYMLEDEDERNKTRNATANMTRNVTQNVTQYITHNITVVVDRGPMDYRDVNYTNNTRYLEASGHHCSACVMKTSHCIRNNVLCRGLRFLVRFAFLAGIITILSMMLGQAFFNMQDDNYPVMFIMGFIVFVIISLLVYVCCVPRDSECCAITWEIMKS